MFGILQYSLFLTMLTANFSVSLTFVNYTRLPCPLREPPLIADTSHEKSGQNAAQWKSANLNNTDVLITDNCIKYRSILLISLTSYDRCSRQNTPPAKFTLAWSYGTILWLVVQPRQTYSLWSCKNYRKPKFQLFVHFLFIETKPNK